MSTTLKIAPLTRVEGHLEVQVTVDTVNGQQVVVDAKCAGTSFRGFEAIMKGRDPLDASQITQRICGVCPISHGMAASLAMESAFKVTPPINGVMLRNLVLASNFVQSHILHFYHLALPDYVDTSTALNMAPWTPRYITQDLLTGDLAARFIGRYLTALTMRRKAHQMGAIIGGKMPCAVSLVPGGCTDVPTAQQLTDFRALLKELQDFIDNVYLDDVQTLAANFQGYYNMGVGAGNLLAYGVFDLDPAGSAKLLARGRYTQGTLAPVDTAQITEHVKYSLFSPASGNLNPSKGVTEISAGKGGAYSWIKAPRYAKLPHEAGPLARMWVNGDYRRGISAMDRIVARAYEAKKIADAMSGWVANLVSGGPVYTNYTKPAAGTGIGLTEAPRGALGHWVEIAGGKVSRYQFVAPTGWNASPRDDAGVPGPLESAIMSCPVADVTKPIEVLRVIHSFDPCLSCAVHLARPGRRDEAVIITG